MTAHAYTPKGNSNNYLHLGVEAAEVEIGDQLHINVNFKTSVPNQDITYLVGITHVHIVVLW